MATLSNCSIKGKIKFIYLLNIVTFIILICTCSLNNDVFNYYKSLEVKCIQYRTSNISFNRLLAKNKLQRESEGSETSENSDDNIVYRGLFLYEPNKASRRSHLNEKILTKLDVYMREYRRRYSRKKGLEKLECYYEKKLFDLLERVSEIAEKTNYDKKRCKKILFRKYGIKLILFILFPLLGFIMPILFWSEEKQPALINFCTEERHSKSLVHPDHKTYCNCNPLQISENALLAIDRLNTIFFAIAALVNAAIMFYMFIKGFKYQRLKSKHVKMRIL
ncbi:Plasmodium exported protein, unknown function [Plasmodium vivax]|uniref:Variable surface protein Vir35 n=1 Tax=Plasmodium vivax TaxID=5855 RepID=A0A564ZRN3_PLAVI|nr:Plasmodium exported protein, unknown function [Plasmodium vivax]